MSNLVINSSQEFLTSLGFKPMPFLQHCDTIEEVISICMNQTIKSKLDSMDIEFDGLVIKIKDNNLRALLGSTNHHPRRAIAYKYPAKQATSVIEKVERQVGRSGILTPVAHVKPIQLSWVTISRVTLHNPDFIHEKDIRIWDHVFIQRSWEVIPYIVCMIPELRNGSEVIIWKPELCPVCNDPISTEKADSGNTSYYCFNINCPATIKEKIKHFVSRDMMNIEWIGDAIIEAMVDNQIIFHFTDLYKLITDPSMRMIVKNLPGMGEKKIEIIIQWLEQSKSKELYKILYALGIPQVGEKTAKILSDTIRDYSMDDLLGRPNNGQNNGRFSHTNLISFLSNRSFLEEIHSIGPETCNSILDRANNTHNQEALSLLSQYGIRFNNFGSEIIRESEKLQYIRFAISGTFQISRESIISTLVKQWATYCPNITKNTNLLIVWLNPSSKVSKASKQGIETVEWLTNLEKRLDIDFGLDRVGLF